MHLDDAQELAKLCSVPKEDLISILLYFHENSGVVLYYADIPLLKEKVICHPQLLIDAFNAFIMYLKSNSQALVNGQINSSLIHSALTSINHDTLNLTHVKELLKYFQFISEKKIDDTSEVCFVPFILPEGEFETDAFVNNFPSPFLIQFSNIQVPNAIFYTLVCQLFHIWQLKNEQQYKNRITFQIEGNITCTLSLHNDFIEVTVNGAIESTPHILFQYIREEVMENLQNSMNFFSALRNVEPVIRFFCPRHSYQHPLHVAVVCENPLSLFCKNCKKSTKITAEISVWISTSEVSICC